MNELILRTGDIPVVNPPRLAEECETALGEDVALYVRQEAGQVVEVRIALKSGQPLMPEQSAALYAVAAAHDPDQPSSDQAAEQALADRANAARQCITALGADGVRRISSDVTGLPDLAEVVADIVEALDLDVSR